MPHSRFGVRHFYCMLRESLFSLTDVNGSSNALKDRNIGNVYARMPDALSHTSEFTNRKCGCLA